VLHLGGIGLRMATSPSRLFEAERPPSEGAIVLLEDNAADVFFVRRAFAHAQFVNAILSFATADGVRGYLEKARQAPALFILDVQLAGGETGIAFLHWLRQQRLPLGGTPAMMLTGSTNPDHRDDAAMLGSIYYLQKPVTSASLIAAVEALGLLVRRLADTAARVIERP
jgi:DNA-binding response OmpR family regulator